jgi:O-antigen biosynthesis protein
VNIHASGNWEPHGTTASCQAVPERTGEVDRLQLALLARATEISRLLETQSKPATEIKAARQALLDLRREADSLRDEFEAHDTRRVAHIHFLHDEIAALRSSTSWRMTAPVRAIANTLQRLRLTAHRLLGLVSEAGAVFLGRAVLGLLRHYRQYVPERIRRFASAHLPSRFKRPRVLERAIAVTGYEKWILQNEKFDDGDRNLIHAHIASFEKNVKISVLMPVYDTPVAYLQEALDSVLNQLYRNWELCIADDASASEEVRETLRSYARQDDRIKVRFRDTNGGICVSTNTALEMATGEWIVLMDHDDALAPHALYLVAEAINRDPGLAIIYSDEDHLDEKGRRNTPYFKPDWDYDLCLSQNLINHLGAYRTAIAREVGGFRKGVEGSQDWDFALRVLEAAGHAKVHHIPFILYHWRQTCQMFSAASAARTLDAACRAVSGHLERTGQAAEVTALGLSSHLRVRRRLPAQRPLVSIIVPTKDQSRLLKICIDGLTNRTSYKPVEIVIVDNGSCEPNARNLIAALRFRDDFIVVEDKGPFNFSRLVNAGIAASSGEICVLLNNDVDVINADWLDEMVAHALRPEVGAVGAKLYYADGTLQHGGVLLGVGGVAGHQHRCAPRDAGGYFGRLHFSHSLSCVTAACLAVRRAVYDEVAGFDEEHLAVAFNDVDFCIRVREAGYRIIWTPHAQLYHYESRSRGADTTSEKAARFSAETGYMRTKWGHILDNDPFYNPNLSLKSDFFELAPTSRVRRPWLNGCTAGAQSGGSVRPSCQGRLFG